MLTLQSTYAYAHAKHCVSTIQMGLVMTQSHKYIIHPVESGAGEGSPHVMFNAEDWSMINGTTERIDGKIYILCIYKQNV